MRTPNTHSAILLPSFLEVHSITVINNFWSEAEVLIIPTWKRNNKSPMRSRLFLVIKPTLKSTVDDVYRLENQLKDINSNTVTNNLPVKNNNLIQSITIHLKKSQRITGFYFSPCTFTNSLIQYMKDVGNLTKTCLPYLST